MEEPPRPQWPFTPHGLTWQSERADAAHPPDPRWDEFQLEDLQPAKVAAPDVVVLAVSHASWTLEHTAEARAQVCGEQRNERDSPERRSCRGSPPAAVAVHPVGRRDSRAPGTQLTTTAEDC
eukprot:COSAG06_NODE_484_length_15127_cov_3.402116_8_plen_122_part_00